MSDKTHLDNVVHYPSLVVTYLSQQQDVLNLLADKLDATEDDVQDNNGYWKFFFDYDYIPETITESRAYICIDTSMVASTPSIQSAELYVDIFCHKDYMKINHTVFRGLEGNRMNNFIRFIDVSLRGRRDFGIGRIEFISISSSNIVNTDIVLRRITYRVKDFNVKRDVINE